MILETLEVERTEFERRTGWSFQAQGACKGDVCVPMPIPGGDSINVRVAAETLNMPLIHDEASGLWCLGPEAGGHALTTAEAPDLVLPDVHGDAFRLDSLRGQKVLLVAWASW